MYKTKTPIILLILLSCLMLGINLSAYYCPGKGRFLNRDHKPEVNKSTENKDLNILYAFSANSPISHYDYLGLWKYEFVTKVGAKDYGHIYATAEDHIEDRIDLAMFWNYGSQENAHLIKKIEGKTKINKITGRKSYKGCKFDIFDIMPKYYQDAMKTPSKGGNCFTAALGYIGALDKFPKLKWNPLSGRALHNVIIKELFTKGSWKKGSQNYAGLLYIWGQLPDPKMINALGNYDHMAIYLTDGYYFEKDKSGPHKLRKGNVQGALTPTYTYYKK